MKNKKILLTTLSAISILAASATGFCACSKPTQSKITPTPSVTIEPTIEPIATPTATPTKTPAPTPTRTPVGQDFFADFSQGPAKEFYAAHGWYNPKPFNCLWLKQNCKAEDGIMKMIVDTNTDGTYTGSEYRTTLMYGYGLFETSMKPIKNSGVISSFLNYTGPYEGDPWDEIDIEFLGKDTTKVQFNYYTNGTGDNAYIYDLGFDASEDFHTYAYRWTKDSITWYVDGVEVYRATENIPTTPGRIMITAWNSIGVDSWSGAFNGNTPLAAEYEWVRYTAE